MEAIDVVLFVVLIPASFYAGMRWERLLAKYDKKR